MDDSDFHAGMKSKEDQDTEWSAAAEHFIRLKMQTKSPEQEQEKTAYEIKPSDRTDIPKKDFAQPNKEEAGHEGKYPIPDRQHARSALGFAKMHHDSGALSAVRAKIEKKYPDMLSGEKEKTAGLSESSRTALKASGIITGASAVAGGLGGALNARKGKKLKGALKGAGGASLATLPMSLLVGAKAHTLSSILSGHGYKSPGEVAQLLRPKLKGSGRVIDPKYTVTSRSTKAKLANALDTFKSFKDPRVAIPAAAGALLMGGLTYAGSKPRPELGGKSRAEEATGSIIKGRKGEDESQMGLGRKLARRTSELSHGIAEAFRHHPLKATAMGATSGALSGATLARMMGAKGN